MHPSRLHFETSCNCSFPWKKVDFEVNPLPGLCPTAWEDELSEDCDRQFILSGIASGFDIIDEGANINSVSCKTIRRLAPTVPVIPGYIPGY